MWRARLLPKRRWARVDGHPGESLGRSKTSRRWPMPRLGQKVALVTGCSGERGIGRAIARRLAEDGADVVLTSSGVRLAINKPTSGWGGLEAVAKEVRDTGRRALTVSLAAGPAVQEGAPVTELSEDVWEIELDVNLEATFLGSKAAAGAM